MQERERRESQEDRRMNWEDVIPSIATGRAAQATEPAMDSDRFAAFYQRSSRPLWAYLARASGNAALADDLMQESYVRFLSAGTPGDGEVVSRKYLFRIASNLLRHHWRKAKTISIDELPEGRAASHFAVPDTSAQTDSRLTLDRALAQLRPRDRQLLWLAHAESYTHREIAEMTGLNAASIRLLLFRARREMAKLLREKGETIL